MNREYSRIIEQIDFYRKRVGVSPRRIGIAVMDTGIFLHKDIAENVISFYDCVEGKNIPYDDNGHGTHVSGIIAGTGMHSMGKCKGINPNANIVSIKVLGKKGSGKTTYILKGIDYLLKNKEKYNIRILNISVGGNYNPKDKDNNILIEVVEKAWKAGVVVVAAAGNNGPENGSITVPGVSKRIITVGSSDDIRNDKKNRTKNNISNYSGRGPTCNCIVKPDIICPGNGILSLKNNIDGYVVKSGTSMATPIVSGLVSIMLEKNPNMMPKDVKKILLRNTIDTFQDKNIQGYGKLDIGRILNQL